MVDAPFNGSARTEALVGITAGLVLALIAWLGSGESSAFLSSHLPPKMAADFRQANPVVTATPIPTEDCVASASTIGTIGFDPYAILARKRPDVLSYYGQNGWDPATQCVAIYDDWTKEGAGGKQPTTPTAFVKAQGWAPEAPVATPAPPADCAAPASEVAQLGFDPYQILALHRPDVLNLYKMNGWNPDTQCVKLFDNWLQHPDGGPPVTAAAFVVDKGWARAPVPAVAATPTINVSPTATPAP